MSNEAIDALRQKVAELEATTLLQARVGRLSDRLRRGPGLGSPAAMRTKTPPPSIGGSGGDDWERVREEFRRLGQYEKM